MFHVLDMQVAHPLIFERDLYLAWSLKRSKAVNANNVVVGVIGAGHLPGVVHHLVTNSKLRFKDLVGRTSDGQQRTWIQQLGFDIAIATLLWYGWQVYQETM